jgi:hypothetical protein
MQLHLAFCNKLTSVLPSPQVVFSTGMVGYNESLTDPSYKGQVRTSLDFIKCRDLHLSHCRFYSLLDSHFDDSYGGQLRCP